MLEYEPRMTNREAESQPIKESGHIPKAQFNFFELVSKLSEVKRQGWVDLGIENPESVAEHSYQVTLMSTVEAQRRGLNVQRTSMMALIHDLSEIYAGDITPYQHLPEPQRSEAMLHWTAPSEEAIVDKHKKEEDALRKITQRLPLEFRTSILELWQEYNEGQTPEAKLVHQMDHIQRLLQAKKYRDQEESFSIDSFIQHAMASDDPEVKRLAKKIQKEITSSE
ncbi:MAG: HD domain-containing protein [bacterium]|nr:HD domain-containing protein [bacterium]